MPSDHSNKHGFAGHDGIKSIVAISTQIGKAHSQRALYSVRRRVHTVNYEILFNTIGFLPNLRLLSILGTFPHKIRLIIKATIFNQNLALSRHLYLARAYKSGRYVRFAATACLSELTTRELWVEDVRCG